MTDNEKRNHTIALSFMGLPELQSTLWDLYKDVTGFRPRHLTEHDWADRDFMTAKILNLLEQL